MSIRKEKDHSSFEMFKHKQLDESKRLSPSFLENFIANDP